ncbi:MAG: LptA/OstA family protein [Polyangiaceae bacterium]
MSASSLPANPRSALLGRLIGVVGGASLVALTLSLWLEPSPAAAVPLATIDGKVLELKADSLDLDLEAGTATLQGHVRAELGKLKLRAERVELEYDDAPKVRRVRAIGGVNALYDGARVKASRLEVDVVKNEAELLGGVEVRRGGSQLRAAKARIDLKTKKLKLEQVSGSFAVDSASKP